MNAISPRNEGRAKREGGGEGECGLYEGRSAELVSFELCLLAAH